MSDGEVKKIASGGGIVLVASLVDRAVRFAVTWLLSTSLGAGDFGVYTHAVTVVTVITVLSPLGLNSGAVYFGAQYANRSVVFGAHSLRQSRTFSMDCTNDCHLDTIDVLCGFANQHQRHARFRIGLSTHSSFGSFGRCEYYLFWTIGSHRSFDFLLACTRCVIFRCSDFCMGTI